MSNKFYLILIILVVVTSGVGYWFYNQGPDLAPDSQRQACLESGGEVTHTNCCESVGDFSNQCKIGACGCAPQQSHQVKVCECGEGKCFDGEKCVPRGEGEQGNFEQQGNLISQQGKRWILIYEESDKPVLTVELKFDEDSVCDLQQGKKPCSEYDKYGESGDRVKVVGDKKEETVKVQKLIYVK